VAYVRRKRLKGHDYYYLVESYRQGGKVKTRTLKYLGTTPEVPAKFQYLLEATRARRGQRQGLLWDPRHRGAAIADAVKSGPTR
jgi:hypothetical protein